MKVQVIGWRAKNLRGYLRDVDIDLSASSKRWTLLQMPNGTGKTTTMALLRLALNGRAISNEEVMGFRADDTVADGLFALTLEIDAIRYEIRMQFDFRRPGMFFQTNVPSETSGGLQDRHYLPAALRDTLRSGVTELFVFDGELASMMISESATRADQAIRSLYRLDLFAGLATDINRQLEQRKRAARVTQISTRARIGKLQEEYDEANKEYKRLQRSERKLRKSIAEAKVDLETTEEELRKIAHSQEEFQEEQATIEKQIGELKEKTDILGEDVLRLFRSPPQIGAPFRQRLEGLGGTLDQHKLPRSMSREFFFQLANSRNCVCGRAIGEHEKHEILAHMEEYLGQDEIAVINQMKSRLQAIESAGETFADVAEELRQTLSALHLFEQQQQKLRDRMKEEGMDIVVALETKKAELVKKVTLEEDVLSRLTQDSGSRLGDWRNNLPACREMVKERGKRLATAEGTLEFRQKADKLTDIVRSTETFALRRLRERIQEKANGYLGEILVNELIQIGSIDGHLRLTGEAAIKKDSVSEGQKLAVAYAFLAALLAEAHQEFPLIVDSPAVSLDVELRRTVGALVPQLFEQMLMFVISSERDGFADSFFDKSDAKFLTISLDPVTGRTGVVEGVESFRAFQARDDEPQ